ncbi:MAG: molybdopterin molybdotransferase MoeA [Phycisphaerales bacterium]
MSALEAVEDERVSLARAGGRVLAQRVVADRPSPAMDYSAMDGFAVRADDVAGPGAGGTRSEGRGPRLRVLGELRIGREPPALPAEPGAALRIVTGAPIPAGADAVIMRERTRAVDGGGSAGDGATEIEIDAAHAREVCAGMNIRRTGENAAIGAVLLEPGMEVTAPVAGVLASVGAGEPRVHRRVRVAILSTGDELVDPTSKVAPTQWQVRDSNAPALGAMLATRAWIEVLPAGRLPDDRAAIVREVGETLARVDALLLTGGVSMGERDFVPGVLAELGVRTLFHKLRQRPGRPVLAGVDRRGVPVLALPGNPVSVLVTARRLALAALRRRAGFAQPDPPPARVLIVNPDEKSIDLWWHRLASLEPGVEGRARLVDARGSGDVVGAGRSDGFVEMPPGAKGPGPWAFYAW